MAQELKYNEQAERFAPIVEKSLCAGSTAVMVPSETGCWVHYAAYCERIASIKDEQKAKDEEIAGLKVKLKVQTSNAEKARKLKDSYRMSYYEAVKKLYDKNKEIAELEESHKNEVKQLLILNSEQANAANRLRNSMEQVIFHQKYKRCLGNAEICQLRLERYERYLTEYKDCNSPTIQRWRFLKRHYEKWYKRWIALAEKRG